MKDLLEEYRYDEEFIYEGLRLDLSYYLKRLMEEKGITKKELAKRMGVSPAYVTKIFSGSNISLKTVAKVLSALEVDARLVLEDAEICFPYVYGISLQERDREIGGLNMLVPVIFTILFILLSLFFIYLALPFEKGKT